MEDSANRYFLVMFLRKESQTFLSEKEAKTFIEGYNKRNRDSVNPEVGGKLKTVHKSKPKTWIVSYNIYRKITKKTSLETIDYNTSEKYDNEKSLKTKYVNDVRGGNGKLYVGYMDDGEVKLIPIAYKKDRLFVDYEQLINFMVENSSNQEFVSTFWSRPKLMEKIKYKKNSKFYMSKIHEAYGEYWMTQNNLDEIKELIKDFVRVWCTSDGKINQRLVRELGSIIKISLSILKKPKGEIKPLKIDNKKLDLRLF